MKTKQDRILTNRSCELVIVMAAAPGRELVVTNNLAGYVRDFSHNFVAGPFEQEDYQPLIDAGQLVESEEFCSVFVLATTTGPPDFSGCDLGQIQGEEGGQTNG